MAQPIELERLRNGTMLPIVACALGVCLALQLHVFVLVPVTLVGIAFFAAFGYASGEPVLQATTACCLNIFLCQAGYLLGLIGREPIARLKRWQLRRV